MSKIITIFLLSMMTICIGCNNSSKLSDFEIKIITEIDFDIEIVQNIKTIIKEPLYQYETADPGYTIKEGEKIRTNVKKQKGICFTVQDKDKYRILENVNLNKTPNYISFISDYYGESDKARIVLLKTTDKYDIIRYENTDGINYDIDNEILIKKLKQWDKLYKIQIIGASFDWVEIKIENLPSDIDTFAQEVYKFCPDIIDQGVGSMESLIDYINNNKSLFLWWD